MKIPISLPTGLPARGATFSCGRILATDGFECRVYSVEEKCYIPTKRPYGFISSSCECGDLVATGGNCSNKVYILSADLTETDGFTPKINAGPLLSVYPCPNGAELVLSYRNACYLSDCRGNILRTLRVAGEDGDIISCFPLCCACIQAFEEGDRNVIEYNGNRCTLPQCAKVKGFALSEEETVYALVNKGYPYSFLIPVLEDGVFNCGCIG